MNPFEVMESHKDKFTKNDLQIYEMIKKMPEQVTYQSTNRLAESCGVSQPALTRFVKMLGYQKFQDFRSDMTAWLARSEPASAREDRLTYFERLSQLMTDAEAVLTDGLLTELAAYVLRFPRIFASGIGKSFLPAHLLQALLRKYNLFVTPVALDYLNETADHLNENDLLILFSVSAQAELMEKAVVTAGHILLITTNGAHRYQEYVDKSVVLPFLPPDPEKSSVSPVLFCVFAELLSSYIEKELLKGEEKDGQALSSVK